MTDEGGVLGNLPNSRPGRRSAKRDRPAKTAERAAVKVKAEASGAAAAKPARTARSGGRTTAVKAGDSEDRPTLRHESSGDPLGAVVRGAAGLALTGVKLGGAVTKELLRRLPRP